MKRRYYWTHADEIALERAVRRAQAAELRRLLLAAARKLKLLVAESVAKLNAPAQPAAVAAPKRRAPAAGRLAPATDIEAFAASLPADIRSRYASELAAAARVEPLVNAGLAAADFAARSLAQGFHAVARGLHAAARSLDVVANRLTPTH